MSLKVPVWWKNIKRGFIILTCCRISWRSIRMVAKISDIKLTEPQSITITHSITWSIYRLGKKYIKSKFITWIERFILHDEKSIQGIYFGKQSFCRKSRCRIDNEAEITMLLLLLLLPFFNRLKSQSE